MSTCIDKSISYILDCLHLDINRDECMYWQVNLIYFRLFTFRH